MTMLETFAPEQIALIAQDRERVPSANNLFVRYEDHAAAMAELRAAGRQPFDLPIAGISNGTLGAEEGRITRQLLRASRYKPEVMPGSHGTATCWVKPFEDAAGVRYSMVIDVVMSVNAHLKPERHLKAHAQFFHKKGIQIQSLVIDGQFLREVEDHFASLWNTGFHIHCDKADVA